MQQKIVGRHVLPVEKIRTVEDEISQDIATEEERAPQQRGGIQDQIARYYLQVQENGGREL